MENQIKTEPRNTASILTQEGRRKCGINKKIFRSEQKIKLPSQRNQPRKKNQG